MDFVRVVCVAGWKLRSSSAAESESDAEMPGGESVAASCGWSVVDGCRAVSASVEDDVGAPLPVKSMRVNASTSMPGLSFLVTPLASPDVELAWRSMVASVLENGLYGPLAARAAGIAGSAEFAPEFLRVLSRTSSLCTFNTSG